MAKRTMKLKMKKRPGMVLVVALLLMAIMSIIGAAAMTTSKIDISISYNAKVSRQVFYFAEGGVEQGPKYIRSMVDAGAAPVVPNVTIDAGLYNEVMGFAAEDDPGGPPTTATADYQTGMGSQNVYVDVDRVGSKPIAGSGVEFGAGAEGAGVGSMGGIMIFYTMDSLAQATNNAESRLDVYYRFVLGVAGGK